MEIDVNRVHTAILFALLFVTVGWIAPAAYASHAPESQFIEVHSFSAQDATTADDRHLICFDRTVYEPNSGTIFTELYLIDGETDTRTQVKTETMERYFQSGTSEVSTLMPLGDHIEAGEYQYMLVVEMDLTEGRVQREFTYKSDTFNITESNQTTADNNTFNCK